MLAAFIVVIVVVTLATMVNVYCGIKLRKRQNNSETRQQHVNEHNRKFRKSQIGLNANQQEVNRRQADINHEIADAWQTTFGGSHTHLPTDIVGPA